MLGRKQEIDLKLNQLFDGIIVAIAFWLSHNLRFNNVGGIWPEEVKIPEFRDFLWLVFIIVPFTPLILEFHIIKNLFHRRMATYFVRRVFTSNCPVAFFVPSPSQAFTQLISYQRRLGADFSEEDIIATLRMGEEDLTEADLKVHAYF